VLPKPIKQGSTPIRRRRWNGGTHTVKEFGSNVERHRRELLVHCYRMLGSLPDAEDAVQETLLHAWRNRDSVKEGAPLRHGSTGVATNACLESIFVVWFPASSETFQ